jgi:hypothetical protein
MCPLCYGIDHEASSLECPSNIQKQKEREIRKAETGFELSIPPLHMSPVSIDEFKIQYNTFYQSLNPSSERTSRTGIKYDIYFMLNGVHNIPKMCIDPETNYVVRRIFDDKSYIAIAVQDTRTLRILDNVPIPDSTCMMYMFIPRLPEFSNLPKPGSRLYRRKLTKDEREEREMAYHYK